MKKKKNIDNAKSLEKSAKTVLRVGLGKVRQVRKDRQEIYYNTANVNYIDAKECFIFSSKSNENFTKLNMKKRSFAPMSKIAQKLKGSALKRFLFRMASDENVQRCLDLSTNIAPPLLFGHLLCSKLKERGRKDKTLAIALQNLGGPSNRSSGPQSSSTPHLMTGRSFVPDPKHS
uniref:Uncharacterized protein n=1 Tax=Romanomermis culicivorax TaxID=13658 RepID=A0A915HLZ7_ROMCU